MLLRLSLVCSLMIVATFATAQENTFLAPTPVMEGEDAELRKSLYEEWNKAPRGLKVSGAVFDSTGKSLARAKLTILAAIGVELEGRADEQGKFQFELPASRPPMGVIARSEEGDLLAVSMPTRPARDGTLSLKLTAQPTKEVTIKVCNKAGKPIVGAYCGVSIAGIVFAKGKSDAEGRFAVRAPESIASEYEDEQPEAAHFYAIADGFGLNVVKGDYVDTSFEFPNELVLPPAQPLTIKVTDRDGKPLAGIPTFLPQFSVLKAQSTGGRLSTAFRNVHVPLNQDLRSFAKSDEKGEATFAWFVAPKMEAPNRVVFGPETRMPVMAIHPQWKTSYAEIKISGDKIEASCTVYSPSRIRGRVLLPSGDPAAGIVLTSREDAPNRRTITTDAKGEFELAATMVDSEIKVSDAKWVSDTIELSTLVRQAAEHHVELKLREGKRVKIRVTAGPQYAPLTDHSVTLDGAGASATLITDKEGRAETMLDRGIYRINAMSNEIYRQLRAPKQSAETTILVKDLAEIEIPIHFDTVQPRIVKVTILKPDGVTAVEKAKVEILNPFQADAATTTQMERVEAPWGPNRGRGMEIERDVPIEVSVLTDSAGKAELRAPVDAPAILMVSSDNEDKALAGVDILADSATITLRKAVSAKGKLLDEATGDPIAGREVEMTLDFARLTPYSHLAPRASVVSRRNAKTYVTTTDEEGNFEIKDLIGDAVYTIQVVLTTSKPGAARPAVRPAMITLSGGRGDRIVRTEKEGVTELGELKAKVYTPPMNVRPGPPNRNLELPPR